MTTPDRRSPRVGEKDATPGGRPAPFARASRAGPTAGAPERASIPCALEAVRRRVAVLSRMLAADRPVPELLTRISVVRADLRAVRRRLLLDHVRRSLEETLPGDRHARARREVLELFGRYPGGRPPGGPAAGRAGAPRRGRTSP